MSIRVMSLVWDNFNRGGSDKLAMLALADWCNDLGGSLYPSIASIAKKINTSDCQARRIVHGLIDEGYLSVVGNHAGGNPGQARQYQMNLQKLSTPSVDATPSMDATPSTHARLPLAPMRVTPSAHASLTTNEPSIEPPIKSKAAPATRLPADWKPSADDLAFCKAKRPDLNPADVADSFVDYWIAQAGAKGRKADWHATWRNWIRNQRQAAPPKYESEKDRSRRETLEGLTGVKRNDAANSTERDITAYAERVG